MQNEYLQDEYHSFNFLKKYNIDPRIKIARDNGVCIETEENEEQGCNKRGREKWSPSSSRLFGKTCLINLFRGAFFFSLKEDGRYIEVRSLYALMSVERIQPGEISNFLDWNTLEDVLNRFAISWKRISKIKLFSEQL